ncbi:hypothetical protein SAMN02745866_01675 [Alteromonadaceae bacterium Bs31]|nr:hypothetical protein SAMN02745866_01675 [Alteromonadaceae bacterium Bs31]
MTDQTDFENLLPTITAIASDKLKTSAVPIGVYAQEAEDLQQWAQKDIVQLQGAGLPENALSELAARTGALREAEARWQTQYRARREATAKWQQQSPGAYEQRDYLLRAFRFAFRKNADLLKTVAKISEGQSHADMIQDLATLAAQGKQQPELLNSIKFDNTRLTQAATLADEMATLLAEANGDKLEQNDARLVRDQAFIYLKEWVDEIRACGKYVFFDNEQRLKGYISAYRRTRSLNSAAAARAQEAVETAEA